MALGMERSIADLEPFRYKNFKCLDHNKFFEVNIYQKDPVIGATTLHARVLRLTCKMEGNSRSKLLPDRTEIERSSSVEVEGGRSDLSHCRRNLKLC